MVPSRHVRAAGDAEHLVLLDLAAGEYFMLDALGARVWRHLAERRPADPLVTGLAREHGVPRKRVRRDVDALVSQLVGDGLLVPADDPRAAVDGTARGDAPEAAGPPLTPADAPRPRPTLRAVLAAWAVLARIDLLAVRGGLGAVLGSLPPLPSAPPRDRDPGCVPATVAAVDRARALHPRRTPCLPRSAACTWLLRRRGIAARLVLGVTPVPFYAHAWVEVDGRVANDGDAVRRMFVLDRF